MRRQTRSAEEYAEELASARRRPFTAFGRDWQGDIFYSDVFTCLKSEKATHLNSEVCKILTKKGFYLHS